MTVHFLAMTALRADAVVTQSDLLLRHGVEVSLLTAEPEAFTREGLDPRVRVHVVDEQTTTLWRAETLLVRRVPRAASAAVARAVRGRRPAAADRLVRLTGRGSDVLHHTGFLKPYKVVRPYVLWRVAARGVLTRMTFERDDEVVVVDSQAVPLAWRLARRYPWLTVGFALDRDRYLPRPPDRPAEAAEV